MERFLIITKMEGWIKISRDIASHWIWGNDKYLKWWIDLLIMASWNEEEVNHDTHTFTLQKGQMIMSIQDLCVRWKASRNAVLKFIQLCEKRDMLIREVRYRQTPIITICNYESYQCNEKARRDRQRDTQRDRQRDTLSKESKEQKEIFPPHPLYKEKKESKENDDKEDLTPVITNVITPPFSQGGGVVKNIDNLQSCARKAFEEHFFQQFNEYYYWTAKDAGCMKKLTAKIKFSRKQKGMSVDEGSIVNALKAMLDCIDGDWLMENFSVANINSKYNEIVSAAHMKMKQRNGTL